MQTSNYFSVLVNDIHSVVIATTDEKGLPVTRVVDIMLHDENGLYFLSAKGKMFHKQLSNRAYISLSGITGGKSTMQKKAISISGSVHNIGTSKLDEIFEKNPYMSEIYKSPESRTALEVFCLYKGKGEYFDLSTNPITRGSFAFGGAEIENHGYFITMDCSACGKCLETCPTKCIDIGTPYIIRQENCLHCGNCYSVCPVKAIEQATLK